MIVLWRSRGPEELVGVWQGMSLSLRWESPSWRVYVDGQRCRQRMNSAQGGMALVDQMIERVIAKVGQTAYAAQRPLTPRPPVGIVRTEARHASL